jgi:hypothetical protein
MSSVSITRANAVVGVRVSARREGPAARGRQINRRLCYRPKEGENMPSNTRERVRALVLTIVVAVFIVLIVAACGHGNGGY